MPIRTITAAMLLGSAAPAADPVDVRAWPELAASAPLPPIVAKLRRTLKDPRSIRDFVLCSPSKVKLAGGRPVRWSVLFS